MATGGAAVQIDGEKTSSIFAGDCAGSEKAPNPGGTMPAGIEQAMQ
jgi:hypothetical protein